MADLTRFQRWSIKRGPLRDRYWRWYLRRLERWAKRNNVPPAPPLDELLKRIVGGDS